MIVAYSLASEGRGHAMRALELGKVLEERGHQVFFFTSGDGTQLLVDHFGEKKVFHLPSNRLVASGSKMCYWSTGLAFVKFLLQYDENAEAATAQVRSIGANLLICDFETVFDGVARRLKMPYVTVDSQRFVLDAKLDDGAFTCIASRLKLLQLRLLVKFISPSPSLSIVAKGLGLESNEAATRTHFISPMLPEELRCRIWAPKNTHTVAYLRPCMANHVPALARHAKSHGLLLHLYGCKVMTGSCHVKWCRLSRSDFLNDLLSANWVYQTAGTQLLNEVGQVGIPSLCLPETGQWEQEINAALAERAYGNISRIAPEALGTNELDEALARLSIGSREKSATDLKLGAQEAAGILEHFFSQMGEVPHLREYSTLEKFLAKVFFWFMLVLCTCILSASSALTRIAPRMKVGCTKVNARKEASR